MAPKVTCFSKKYKIVRGLSYTRFTHKSVILYLFEAHLTLLDGNIPCDEQKESQVVPVA